MTPNPPLAFALQTLAQAAFGLCFPFMPAPLQRQIFFIWAITVLWTAKVLMQNVGKAENIELVNSGLPA
jgi:hypothetical protein